MQTITTKYHGPTNTQGARISATTSEGIRVYTSYPYEYSYEAAHWPAVQKLCNKLGWKGKFISSDNKTGYVWLFADTGHVVPTTYEISE